MVYSTRYRVYTEPSQPPQNSVGYLGKKGAWEGVALSLLGVTQRPFHQS